MARDAMRTQHAPGMAVCILQRGRTLMVRGYGIADLENAVPVTNKTEFVMASITKQLTAAAILQLAEQGRLSLDDDISRFVPDFPLQNRGVTIRRLLNHTAGVRNLQDLGDRYWKQTAAPAETRQLIDLFKAEPLDFEPGTDYHYSNSGYILLGAVIEKAGGEPYGEYVKHHLLDPVGLKHMLYGGTLALMPHRAHAYWFNGNAFVNAAHFDQSQGFAMGGFYSTAADLARWTVALHHQRVLTPASYQQMITPEVLPNGETLSYGFGMELGSLGGRQLYGHAGGGVGSTGQTHYIPEEDLAVVVMSNSNGGGAIEMADQVMRKILGIPGPADLPLPADMAQRYAGRYCIGDDIVEIAWENDHLVARYGDGETRRLRYQGEMVFAQDGRLARLHFREHGGRVEGFVVARYGSFLARATREN